MTAVATPRASVEIPGWFFWVDRQLFDVLLTGQRSRAPGDLVELGTYLGKSAVLIGDHLRPGERFVALDLFGRTDLLDDHTNRAEVQRSYPTLTRTTFEQNYLAHHDELPVIVEGPSSAIGDHVSEQSVRFLHIDASHLYEHVRADASSARRMLQPGGLVVFDDWRSEHTPGVTAAVWEAVFTGGLIPVAVTPAKFYGVYADPEPYREMIKRRMSTDERFWSEIQPIAGQPVIRINLRDKSVPPKSPTADELARTVSAQVIATVRDELPRLLDDASTVTRIRRKLLRRRRA